jgi:mannose-6-phosphate isomerase-like protein (cupin superfamily)
VAQPEQKSFDTPDERRTPHNVEVAIVTFGDRTFSRITYFPGFRWTVDMKLVAGTDLCQVNHFAYVVCGQCRVQMADGTEFDLKPGDIGTIPAGHDAWVVGNEPFVSIDFAGAIRPE